MHSSVGLVFRALVMLGCLALVPFLAIYGKQLPDFYRAVVEAYKARTQPKGADPLAALGSDAPAWAPTQERGPSGTSWGGGAGGSKIQPTPPAPLAAASLAPAPLAVPPIAAAPWNNAAVAAQPLVAPERSAAAVSGVQPASFATPLESGKSGDPIATSSQGRGNHAEPQSSAAPDSCTAQFRHMEQRLKELGATYYLLETWGSNGDRYRFYCQVALAGNTDYGHNRVFQATDADPLQAMKSVLDQVELWRTGREP
jgi:hypothetical protein